MKTSLSPKNQRMLITKAGSTILFSYFLTSPVPLGSVAFLDRIYEWCADRIRSCKLSNLYLRFTINATWHIRNKHCQYLSKNRTPISVKMSEQFSKHLRITQKSSFYNTHQNDALHLWMFVTSKFLVSATRISPFCLPSSRSLLQIGISFHLLYRVFEMFHSFHMIVPGNISFYPFTDILYVAMFSVVFCLHTGILATFMETGISNTSSCWKEYVIHPWY